MTCFFRGSGDISFCSETEIIVHPLFQRPQEGIRLCETHVLLLSGQFAEAGY